MTDENKIAEGLPEPVVQRPRINASLVWLVPIIAALVGLSLVIHAWSEAGPTISISFQSAEGLDPGKTPVKYKSVVIGKVTTVRLSEDRTHVVAKVALEKSAKSFATADSRFWVVRPRIGLGGVSGIDTLLSGAFIGADVGQSQEPKDDFVGLESPPTVTHGAPGKTFDLHADDLGSLDIGSPIYFRRIQVGRVSSYHLNKDGKGVTLQIFIDAPNDQFVNTSSRFWNASGVDVSLGADGLKVNTQSLATVLAGGVAFQDPPGPHDASPAQENDAFTLFNDKATAMAPPDGEPRYIRMRFSQSLRGLAVDAPVEFLGVPFGRVVSINLDFDEKTQTFPTIVGAVVYPARLGKAHDKLVALAKAQGDDEQMSQMMGRLVEHGLRAQARTGNLLTGQLYIAMDFLPKAPKVEFDGRSKPLEIPTAPGDFDKIQQQIADIVGKVQKVPFDSIGNNLNDTLSELHKTLQQVNGSVLPEVKTTLQGAQKTLGNANNAFAPDSQLQQNLGGSLQELQRAARSLRVLTDYLGDHPDALLRGRRADDKPLQQQAPTPPPPQDAPTQGSKP
ncbi:paraquat-inducible protein B [Dyella jiangningensis]|uniref:PqiB family protein n=1 Tax=Dyella sp. AtDHG13 TaxID=1938897 RepID=UPI000886D653|nr:MlaD family protein [Dyella sp. AtDHG13]PXV58358.1 paraquat-inducible protein B [Dyella sp. AtDHG13]SDK05702.1 paraquat-inducible protein B [Dyella jiangningensis]